MSVIISENLKKSKHSTIVAISRFARATKKHDIEREAISYFRDDDCEGARELIAEYGTAGIEFAEKQDADFVKKCEREAHESDKKQRGAFAAIAQMAADDAAEITKKPTTPRAVQVAPTVVRSNARAHHSRTRTKQTDGGGEDSSDPDGQPETPVKRATVKPFALQIFATPKQYKHPHQLVFLFEERLPNPKTINRLHNQRADIAAWLLDGKIIRQDVARYLFKVMRLAARICELKKAGYKISKRMISPSEGAAKVAEYRLNMECPFVAPNGGDSL